MNLPNVLANAFEPNELKNQSKSTFLFLNRIYARFQGGLTKILGTYELFLAR